MYINDGHVHHLLICQVLKNKSGTLAVAILGFFVVFFFRQDMMIKD